MTAEEKLNEIMECRKWYSDKIYAPTARSYKRLHKKGKLSTDKVREILTLLGYKPIQREKW